jgi:diguanylate cyclase (GGDEF)-like protein/PAS domain S-box-containing protein
LRRAKLLLEATIENIPDGVALLDVARQILVANSAFANRFGLARDQLVGLDRPRFCSLVAERFADPAYFRERLMASGANIRTSDVFVMQSPARRVLRGTLRRVGGVSEVGYLAVWADITQESDLLAERGREAVTDVLTGITNRRGGEAALQAAFSQCQRSGAALSVALFDIDHFKRVNDVYGHVLGDAVLKAVAKTLAEQMRAGDLVARWGGEEFLAISRVECAGALAFCERARAAVSALVLPEGCRVTISAGVASNESATSWEELVRSADERLYAAKQAGRNRVLG